jgi:multiple sugar transport system permease protein
MTAAAVTRQRATRFEPGQAARIGANIALTAIVLAFLGPMLWMFVAAFNPTAQLAFELPKHPGLANFRSVATWDQLYRPLLNSMILSVTASTVTVFAACLCAYPLSRYRLRFGSVFLYMVLMSSGLPVIALMIPTYRLFTKLHFTNNTLTTALFLAGTSLPFAVWLAKNFIDGVPISLEEAARTDGATTWQTMRNIVFPLIRPGMIVLFIFTFIGNWGNFFVPFILFNDPNKQTASVAIYNYFNSLGGVYFGRVAAFAILYSAPAVVLYALISRTLGRSFSFAGASKE